jgi:hypothetical protein
VHNYGQLLKVLVVDRNTEAERTNMKILMVLTSHDRLGNTGRKTGFRLGYEPEAKS